MTDWRFDIENMPRIIGRKNIEIAYVSTHNELTTAIVGWDGMRYVTCRHAEKNIALCPPPTIYAWKMAAAPPAIPETAP